MHVNLVYWNSLHPKKNHFTHVSGQMPHFLGVENVVTLVTVGKLIDNSEKSICEEDLFKFLSFLLYFS